MKRIGGVVVLLFLAVQCLASELITVSAIKYRSEPWQILQGSDEIGTWRITSTTDAVIKTMQVEVRVSSGMVKNLEQFRFLYNRYAHPAANVEILSVTKALITHVGFLDLQAMQPKLLRLGLDTTGIPEGAIIQAGIRLDDSFEAYEFPDAVVEDALSVTNQGQTIWLSSHSVHTGLIPRQVNAVVLDGFGGLHSLGNLPDFTSPYFGWDIARDVELISQAGGYVLDGYGNVHPFGEARNFAPVYGVGFGWDIAKDLVFDGNAYYILDGYGGVHPGGEWVIKSEGPYFGWDIARAIAVPPRQ